MRYIQIQAPIDGAFSRLCAAVSLATAAWLRWKAVSLRVQSLSRLSTICALASRLFGVNCTRVQQQRSENRTRYNMGPDGETRRSGLTFSRQTQTATERHARTYHKSPEGACCKVQLQWDHC